MYILSMIILIFFAVIGLCSFISGILDKLYIADGKAIILIKDLSPGDAEARIRSAARICMRHKGFSLSCICGESEDAYEICKLMQKEYPFLEVIGTDTSPI